MSSQGDPAESHPTSHVAPRSEVEASLSISKDFTERLKHLEDTVSRLELQQDSLRPLFRLTSGGLDLDGLRVTLQDFQKKAIKTQDKLAKHQQRLDVARSNLSTQCSSASSELEGEMKRRQAEADRLAQRLGDLEKGLKQAAADNELAVKEIQVKLKEEVVAVVQNVERRLQEERVAVEGVLKDLNQHSEAQLGGAKRVADQLQSELEQFESRHAGLLEPGVEGDKGSLRLWLLEELRKSIRETVDSCKAEMDAHFKGLRLKFSAELLSIKSQLEQLRNWLNRKSDSQGSLAQINGEVRRLINHLTNYVESNLLNLEQLYASLSRAQPSSKQERSDLHAQLLRCNQERDQLDQISAADWFSLQELTQKANSAVQQSLPASATLEKRNSAAEHQELWRKNQIEIAKLKEKIDSLQARVASHANDMQRLLSS
mmetsp:Transcript_23547/g.41738  ORF Transcript_23547/g.41738 Transcript_23547/m.41738 type:complete len:430 (+) Transcript_23547:2519-3808(+)